MPFKKGYTPWNKGKRGYKQLNRTADLKKTEAVKTMFKKGSVPWNKGISGYKIYISDENKIKFSKKWLQEKNPSWKGGVTEKNILERVRFRREIQKLVFERDDYTCQMCGERGCDLQVDHIQPWAEYVELRFDIDNCRTLCSRCHYKLTFNKEMPKETKCFGHNLNRRYL